MAIAWSDAVSPVLFPVSAGVSPWGCRGGFCITKDFSPGITCLFTPARRYVVVPAGSLLFVADLLVLSSVISPWRSYSAGLHVSLSMGGSLQHGLF